MNSLEAQLILKALHEQRADCVRMLQEAREALKVVANQIVRLERQLDDIDIQITQAEMAAEKAAKVSAVASSLKPDADFKATLEPDRIPVVGLPVCAGQIGFPMLIEGKLFSFDRFEEVALVDHKGNCLEHLTKREFFRKYTPTRLRFEGAGHG